MPEKPIQLTNPDGITSGNETRLLSTSERVVVFGSRLSGAFDLAKALDLYLKARNIPNISLIVERNIDNIANAFYGRGEATVDTLPRGVVVLPEMRWYPDGRGMFVDTHEGELYADKKYETVISYIKSICDENGVPIVDFNNVPTQEELTIGLNNLLAPPGGKEI